MENTHNCDVCRSIQPMESEPPSGPDVYGCFMSASDIICARGGLIIATTYEPNTNGADALRRVMARGR